MTIAVTGGGGFVGLNIVEAALGRGEDVVLISDKPVPENAQRAFASLPGRLQIHIADVRDGAAFQRILAAYRPDALFPFAAITPGLEREKAAPESVVEINVLALMSQIRAARDEGVRKIVAPASGAVYGESTYKFARLTEDETPCVPNTIYGATKCAAETVALRLGEIWDLDIKVARIGGVFGPWEHESGARETFGPFFRMLSHAMAGREIVLSEKIPSACAIYSRDLANALLWLAALEPGGRRVFNISSERNWIKDLPNWADRLVAMFGGPAWRRSVDFSAVNVRTLDDRDRGVLDVTRLSETGWTPQFPGDAALDNFEQWVRQHLSPGRGQ